MMSAPPSDETLRKTPMTAGFTLIELSVVLVIIGLIVGGVLVGRSLIAAAILQAQVSQIEKYQTAVNTFRAKYNNELPGDMDGSIAANLGFIARAGTRGRGDNNGIIEGCWTGAVSGNQQQGGETILFWSDLSIAGLIEDTITGAQECGGGPIPTLPAAKIGNSNSVYVYSPGYCCGSGWINSSPTNYFGISVLSGGRTGGGWTVSDTPGITVDQAYRIDTKIDDGLPQTGKVTAALGGGDCCGAPVLPPAATTDSSMTCYNSASNQYAMSQNNGAGVNCALSFQIQ